MLKSLLKTGAVVLVASWVYLFLTEDAPYYFVSTQTLTFEQYWNKRVSGASPENAKPWLHKLISKEYTEQYLSSYAAYDQERLSLIHSGFVPAFRASAITAQWNLYQWKRQIGAKCYLLITGGLGFALLLFRLLANHRILADNTSGITALFHMIGWYRVTVLIWFILISDYLRLVLLIPLGHFSMYNHFVYFLMAVLFAISFAGLIYQYFLQEA